MLCFDFKRQVSTMSSCHEVSSSLTFVHFRPVVCACSPISKFVILGILLAPIKMPYGQSIKQTHFFFFHTNIWPWQEMTFRLRWTLLSLSLFFSIFSLSPSCIYLRERERERENERERMECSIAELREKDLLNYVHWEYAHMWAQSLFTLWHWISSRTAPLKSTLFYVINAEEYFNWTFPLHHYEMRIRWSAQVHYARQTWTCNMKNYPFITTLLCKHNFLYSVSITFTTSIYLYICCSPSPSLSLSLSL